MRITLTAILLTLTAAPLAAQSGVYVVRLGSDTLAVERFTRSATRIEGELAVHAPRATLRHYAFDLGPDGSPTRGEIAVLRPADLAGTPIQRATATFTSDSIFSEVRRDTAVTRRRIRGAHGTPLMPFGPYGLWELAAARALRSAADSGAFVGYPLGFDSLLPFRAWRIGRDSVGLATPWDVYHARVERDGRIIGSVPLGGTTQFAITRVEDADPRAVAARWAAAEAGSRPMGLLSVRDTIRASIGGGQLMIDYGRPLKRGRVVFGNVVPWGSVWRTGANAATQFRTDRSLEIGGVVVPAGFYTLWTLPTPGGWKLIINSETGQWGTDRRPERDLYQLDMTVSRLPQTVEQFTISVTPGGQGGVMVLEWDQTRATIGFNVRN